MTPRSRRTLIAIVLGLAGIVAMILVGLWIDPRRVVAGDGHYVLATARSLAFDGDLDLGNQYRAMGDRWGLGRDRAADGWSLPPREIGASLLMLPGLWLHWLLGLGPRWEPSFACLAAAASLGPCWLGCVRAIEGLGLEIPSREVEGLAAAAVCAFVGPYYAIGSPGYAHAADAAICAWLCWALVDARRPVVTGMLLACAVLTRLQNVLWVLWPMVTMLAPTGTGAQRRLAPVLVIAGIGSLGLLPQLWLGLAHPGSERGALGWTANFFNVDDLLGDLARVLGGVHGLLRWTPIAALGLLGLGLGLRSTAPARRLALAACVVFAAMWLLFSLVRDVDGGHAYGARRMAGLVGVLALGLGWLWSWARSRARWRAGSRAVLIGLTAINLGVTAAAIRGDIDLGVGRRLSGHR